VLTVVEEVEADRTPIVLVVDPDTSDEVDETEEKVALSVEETAPVSTEVEVETLVVMVDVAAVMETLDVEVLVVDDDDDDVIDEDDVGALAHSQQVIS